MWNHQQSLQTLASRGGLGLDEMAAIVENRRWKPMTDQEIEAFIQMIPK